MATATRATSAKRNAAAPKAKPIVDVDIELTPAMAKAFADLKTARHTKATAEANEKAAKEILYKGLPKQKKHQRLVLRFKNQVLGKVSWRLANRLDQDLVLQGWPECFEACRVESEYQQIN